MSDLIGLTMGNYHMLQKLGDGGMAEVYLAQTMPLKRQVAIKFIRSELSQDENFRTRFEREAQILARLNHPNIIQVYDFGEVNQRYFLAMEYIEGVTLKEYLRRVYSTGKPLSLDEIVKVISQIGEALDYIHRMGIIHRDVKPDNILLTPEGRVCLGDFGVARIIAFDGDQTGSGAILGTPAYMSPEHILSDGNHISPASDIYSLGVILYELISGKPPFTANTPILIMLKHLHDPVPHLANPLIDIPDRIEAVIRLALAKDPAERYQKVSHFIHDLNEALDMTVRLSHLMPEPAIC